MTSPIPILLVILSTLAFEALLFGDTIAEQSFPTFDQPQSSGFLGAIDSVVQMAQSVWGVVVFFFNLITFNIPDAPWWIRLVAGGVLGGGLIWSIAGLIRGGGT